MSGSPVSGYETRWYSSGLPSGHANPGSRTGCPSAVRGQLISNFSIILMSSEEQGTPLLLYLPVYTWVFYRLQFSGSRIFFFLSVGQRSVLNMRPTRKPSRIPPPPFISSESVCPWLPFTIRAPLLLFIFVAHPPLLNPEDSLKIDLRYQVMQEKTLARELSHD